MKTLLFKLSDIHEEKTEEEEKDTQHGMLALRLRTARREPVPCFALDLVLPLRGTHADYGTGRRSGTCFYGRLAVRADPFQASRAVVPSQLW
jgi:hypothetical protein